MPFFSVIIPSYNRHSLLRKAIDSVLSQTFKDFELIVVDDGSTDKTPEIQNEYGNRILYISQENKGVSSARNAGIKVSSSPYIAFLDSDDLWMPEKLDSHHSFIMDNPQISVHQTDEIWIRNGRRVNPKIKHKKKSGDIFIESLALCLISPSSVVIKKKILNKYGLFDENMPVCEDYDLWLRIASDEKIGLIDKKLIIKHGGHESQLSAAYPAMDIYRVYSIIKLLKNKEDLKPEYASAAREAAKKKGRVILTGARKRKNRELADILEDVIKYLNENNYNSIAPGSLLQKAPAP